MDPILEAAEAKREELRQELRKIEDFLATYRSFQLSLRLDSKNQTETNNSSPDTVSGGDVLVSEAARAASATDAAPTKRVRVVGNPRPADVVTAAVKVIRERGRPMSRREIHAALSERGMEVRGADAIKALGTMLWRSGKDVLVQLEGEGYWIKSEQYHPAGYYPDLWRRPEVMNVAPNSPQRPLGLDLTEVDDADEGQAPVDEFEGL